MTNVAPCLGLDASVDKYSEQIEAVQYDAILACNVCHISPYCVTEGIFKGAARLLADSDSRLFLYGPWNKDGEYTSESNVKFDASLQS